MEVYTRELWSQGQQPPQAGTWKKERTNSLPRGGRTSCDAHPDEIGVEFLLSRIG